MQSKDYHLLHLPEDVWQEICQFLEPSDINNLKLVSKSFKVAMDSPKLDAVWMPYLNRLHTLDPSISVVIPKDKTIQQVFVEGIKKIKKDQEAEFRHFYAYGLEVSSKSHEYRNILGMELHAILNKQTDMILDALSSMHDIDKSMGTLKILEANDRTLNKINEKLIEGKIANLKDSTLDLSGRRLTRLPAQIFQNKDTKDVLQQIQVLNLSNNQIRFIPKEIEHCVSLNELNCSDNKITFIPATIANCKELRSLNFHSNEIEELPQWLMNLTPDCIVDFKSNKIQAIPLSLQMKFGVAWAKNICESKELEFDGNTETSTPQSTVQSASFDELTTLFNLISGYLPKYSLKNNGNGFENEAASSMGNDQGNNGDCEKRENNDPNKRSYGG